MSAPRRIVVDDTDSAIQYGSSEWSVADSTKLNTLGNFGPVYNGTSHSTNTNSTLSFPFNGTSINVWGTIAITKDANNVTDPTWDCFVDEIKIDNPNPSFGFAENNWPLCDQAQIASGSHVLKIEVQSKGQPFYLDYILYTPLPTVNYDGAVLEYTNTDPSVSFGSGWRQWGEQNVTQTTGAQVALNFHGTAVSLLGYVPTELPHNSTSGSYTIDGGQPVAFTLKGLAAQSATTYNVLMFTADKLTPATHNLVVTYEGDATKTPLVVSTFYVTNASTPSSNTPNPSSVTSGGLAPSAASTSAVTTIKSSPTGAIVGGTIGCLAVLALLVGLVFWCRRRRRREAENSRRTSVNPFTSTADAAPASVAGANYSYASVPADGYGYPYAQAEMPGTPVQLPMASPTYPYVPPVSSLPSSDATHSAGRSHVHSPSGSSGDFSGSMSMASLPPRPTNVVPVAASYQYPTPVSSDDSLRSHKHEQELLASAAMAMPADSALGLSPLRRLPPPPIVVQRHQDSGVRLYPTPTSEPEIIELPPGYSRD